MILDPFIGYTEKGRRTARWANRLLLLLYGFILFRTWHIDYCAGANGVDTALKIIARILIFSVINIVIRFFASFAADDNNSSHPRRS